MQTILTSIAWLKRVLDGLSAKRVFLVCDSSFDLLAIKEDILCQCDPVARFDEFTPNPKYEEVVDGVRRFLDSRSDAILAVGGGSALDVAKCVNAFSRMDPGRVYLEQPMPDLCTPLIAVPTTAGTGSESTHFAALYYRGEKQSVTGDSLLPDCAILESRALSTLPLYQKKCTMLDALCHAIEAWWSVRATSESREYSREAIALFLRHMEGYLAGSEAGHRGMLTASNLAGRAINLAQTTSGHAMSYKITTLYGIPHGRAVAMCLPDIWEFMLHSLEKSSDLCSAEAKGEVFQEIAVALKTPDARAAIRWFRQMVQSLNFPDLPYPTKEDILLMARSVNPVRMKNSPYPISHAEAEVLYQKIFRL